MIRAKKIRLFPTEEQEQKMWQSVGTARFIYNWTLGKQQDNYKQGGKFISDTDLRKQITSTAIYRRTKRFMPAGYEELQMAIEDGVELQELLSPLYHNEGILYCRKMVLGDRDASGRRSPKETNEIIEIWVDSVIAAVGEQIDKEIYQKMGLFLDDKGHALVNRETLESSLSDVFVIGDGLNGSASVVEAIRDASIAVKAICAKYDIASETESEKEGEKRLYRIRLDGRITEEAVFDDSCTLPEEIKAIIQSIALNYRYCLCKVLD